MLQHCWKWLQIHLTGSGRWRWNNIVISEYICCARFLIRAGWLGSFPYTIGLNYQGPSQWVSCQTLKQTRLKMDCFHSGREVSEKLFIIIAKWVLWYYGLSRFQVRDTKLNRFLAKNQHTQRKSLNFVHRKNPWVVKIWASF